MSLYHQGAGRFAKDPASDAARAMANAATAASPSEVADLAAWTVVANVLLNLDETLNVG